ncbi:MAG: hypothetical protein ACREX6_08340, partial [Casimicrobiaceae bacterium]
FYAPVAFRFQTYGVSFPGAAGEYVTSLLGHRWLCEWEKDALAETAVIEAEEPRVAYRDQLVASR